MRLLVTGATGFVGRSLVPALRSDGHEVLAGTRNPGNYEGPGTPVRIDLADPATLGAALDGVDAAYYLVHSMESHGNFAERDRAAAVAFRDQAAARGIRVVYLGGLGDLQESAGKSEHLRSRHEVGAILRDGADTVELRAAIVIGAGSASFEILRQLVDRLPVMVCPRWVTTRCQPIAAPDVVRYLVGALEIPAGTYEIGGADVLTYEVMMRRYAAITGRRRLIIKVPVLSPRLSSHWIGLITDQSAAVARPLADGLSVEVVVTDDRIRQLIPFDPVGFDDAVVRAIAEERPPAPARRP
ncbi:NAD(P)H-binding protein [Acidiferrimicrobium sp. IK]|uniref:NAD(P)H-binding protein n=1 Tax=Acidiferrimicrobium sp. IK TaxID=2871700 RepID=UPI0021CB7CD5|nr:NAD(P)H-binding protein [Acidiferrimicrobium sp. IK]MCU4187420.1 NAD(P)H-binding protein [Acidiferrimicrobium sp. IK]